MSVHPRLVLHPGSTIRCARSRREQTSVRVPAIQAGSCQSSYRGGGAIPAAEITFTVQSGKTYSVQYTTSLVTDTWQKLADIPAQASLGVIVVSDTAATGKPQRFYRAVTPMQ